MGDGIFDIPADYPARIRLLRRHLDLTQTRLASRIGVSFTTVNRWENGQSRPTRLAWQQILDLEAGAGPEPETISVPREMLAAVDFAASAEAVGAVAEATRLAYGHLVNPA